MAGMGGELPGAVNWKHALGKDVRVELPQDRDTPLERGDTDGFAWRYRYERAADARSVSASGQDYIALYIVRGTLVFVLCDGVSHSFLGDLAARSLGNSLLDWLANDAVLYAKRNNLAAALDEHLISLVEPIGTMIDAWPLPTSLPQLQREALDLARGQGSETTFVCGRIDQRSSECPDGLALFAWMGDSTIRVWGPDGEIGSALGGNFQVAQRWSSRRGPIGGRPHLFVCPLLGGHRAAVSRVIAYSDGLQSLDDSAPPDDDALEAAIRELANSPASDDVSFIDITIHPTQ